MLSRQPARHRTRRRLTALRSPRIAARATRLAARTARVAVVLAACCLTLVMSTSVASASRHASIGGTSYPLSTHLPIGDELSGAKAAVLGVVEGLTEYLPISSTGHLHVTERLLDIGVSDRTKDAADTYAITIQAGAILAVAVLYRRRLGEMARGLVGRDERGRGILAATGIAFVPAAAIGIVFEHSIKDRLLGSGAIVAAWIVGGLALLAIAHRLHEHAADGAALHTITAGQAVWIGAAQCLALWPGTSRSLVTILAALVVGLSVPAAVEFSFLLGLLTLGAATSYEAIRNGGELIDVFGLADPVIGFGVAFVSALVAVRWMVAYLHKHGLSIFGWYRIGVAAVTVVLLATNVI